MLIMTAPIPKIPEKKRPAENLLCPPESSPRVARMIKNSTINEMKMTPIPKLTIKFLIMIHLRSVYKKLLKIVF